MCGGPRASEGILSSKRVRACRTNCRALWWADLGWLQVCWGVSLFLIATIASIAPVVIVLINLPQTYYQFNHPPVCHRAGGSLCLHCMVWLVRNILGFIVIVIGAFLSLPGVSGQRLLTILVGVLLINFPREAPTGTKAGRPSRSLADHQPAAESLR